MQDEQAQLGPALFKVSREQFLLQAQDPVDPQQEEPLVEVEEVFEEQQQDMFGFVGVVVGTGCSDISSLR